jgi:hypothetical protein
VLPGLGETCGYSCFDFDAFQDENWEGRQLGAAVVDDDAHSHLFFLTISLKQGRGML